MSDPTYIYDLDALHEAALKGKAVISLERGAMFGNRPCPAAFVMNLSGTALVRLLRVGMKVYEKASND